MFGIREKFQKFRERVFHFYYNGAAGGYEGCPPNPMWIENLFDSNAPKGAASQLSVHRWSSLGMTAHF